MKRAMFVCLLFGILACPGFSQSSGDSKNENLRNSFAGLGACDLSALRSAQAKQIADMRHDQNLWKCLDGYGECDHTALAESEGKRRLRLRGIGGTFWPAKRLSGFAISPS